MHNADFSELNDPELCRDLMPCPGAFQQSGCFLLKHRSHHILQFNKQSVPEEKIPISSDTGSGFAGFSYFLSQAVAKTAGHQKSTWKASAATQRGIPKCFTSTAHLKVLLTTNPTLETPKENNIICPLFKCLNKTDVDIYLTKDLC